MVQLSRKDSAVNTESNESLMDAGVPGTCVRTFHNNTPREKLDHGNELLQAVDGLKL